MISSSLEINNIILDIINDMRYNMRHEHHGLLPPPDSRMATTL